MKTLNFLRFLISILLIPISIQNLQLNFSNLENTSMIKCFMIRNNNSYDLSPLRIDNQDYDIKFPDGGIITFNFCKNTENLCNNQSILIKYTKGEDCLPLSSTANVSNYWNLINESDSYSGISIIFSQSGRLCNTTHNYTIRMLLNCDFNIKNKELNFTNLEEFNIKDCENTLKASTFYACPIKDIYVELTYDLEKRSIRFIIFIIGVYLFCYGKKYFLLTTFLFGIFPVYYLSKMIFYYYISSSAINEMSLNLVDFLVEVICICLGGVTGVLFLTYQRLLYFCIGIYIGYSIYLLLFSDLVIIFNLLNDSLKISWLSHSLFDSTISFYAKVLLILMYALYIILSIIDTKNKSLLSFACSFIGSYLIIRFLSFFIGGFPSEFILYIYLEREEYDELKSLVSYKLYIYYFVWFFLSCYRDHSVESHYFYDQEGFLIDYLENENRFSINNNLEIKSNISYTSENNNNKHKFVYPGDESLAKKHASTFKIGSESNEICECCNRVIPLPIQLNSASIRRYYGIDLLHLLYSRCMYIFYLLVFILVEVIRIIVMNIDNLIHESKFYGNEFRSNNKSFYFPNDIDICDFIFAILTIVLLISVYELFLKKKFKDNYNIFEEGFYSDESIFSLFVKNIKGITKEQLEALFQKEYSTSVKEIHMIKLNSKFVNLIEKTEKIKLEIEQNEKLKKIEKKKNNLFDKKIESLEFNLKSNLSKITDHLMSNFQPKTAIVVFNKCEDKYKFIQKNLNFYNFFFGVKNKVNIINNKSIYFEEVPQISFINWKNINYSFEKRLNGWMKLMVLIKLILMISLSFGLYLFNIFILGKEFIQIFDNYIKIPFLFPIFIMLFNFIVENLFKILVDSFKLTNRYNNNLFHKYLIMNKTYLTTFIVYLNNFLTSENSGHTEYLSLLQYLITSSLFNIFLTLFNIRYLWNHFFKYLICIKVCRKKVFQKDLNEIFLSNTLNIYDSFNKLRISLFSTLFLIQFLPILSLYMIILFTLNMYILKYAISKSIFKEISYLGNFFKFFSQIDFLRILLIPLYKILILYLNDYFFLRFIITNFIIDFAVSFSFNNFDSELSHSEVETKFKKTFKMEKMLNIGIEFEMKF